MDKFKNVALSLAVIAGVTGLVFGATQAGWTDTATNDGNVFASGQVNIELDGTTTEHAVHSFFDVEGMMPGDSEEVQLLIGNNSTGPVNFDVKLVNPVRDGSPGLDRVLQVRIVQIDDENEIDDPLVDRIGSPDEGKFTLWDEGDIGAEIVSFDTTLRDWVRGDVQVGTDAFELPVKHAGVYSVEVKLAESAGNEYQNKTFTVDLLVTATSVN